MTYFRFHLLFNLPATVALLALAWFQDEHGSQWAPGEGWAALAVLAAVMVFTSPWDNDAVRRGIWDFPPGRYWRRIKFLPFEEYLFFVWQSVNVMLSVGWLLRVAPGWRTGEGTPVGPLNGAAILLLLVFWTALGLRSRKRPFAAKWNYAWHLLYWFLPVIALQWCLAPVLFLKLAPVLGTGTLFWGTYYTAADVVAVRAGVWTFDPGQITGRRLFGILPWEEIAFFYLTSLLVAQSFLLLLPAVLR